MYATIRDEVHDIDRIDRARVNEAHRNLGVTCRRFRNIGNKAKVCTENKMRANTARSSDNREARTTDEDMAAFSDSTDVSLSRV